VQHFGTFKGMLHVDLSKTNFG